MEINVKKLISDKYEVIVQDEKSCLEAVKQDGYAVYYFSSKVEEIFIKK